MRYDKPIFFQHTIPGEYNPITGNYDDGTIIEQKRYASVTDTGTQMLTLVYNSIKQGSLTIRLQRPYTKPFNNIRVDDKVYRVDLERHHKNFIVSEVQ